MLTRTECESQSVSRRDAMIGGALTIGAALVVAAIMLAGDGGATKTIGLVLFPGVLTVGYLWTSLRDRSAWFRAGVIGATFGVLVLIGLLSTLAVR